MNAFLLQAYCGFYSPIEPKYLPAIATGETNTTRPAVFVGSEIHRGFRPVDILHKSCNGPFETLRMNVPKCQLKYPRLQIRTDEKTIGSQ